MFINLITKPTPIKIIKPLLIKELIHQAPKLTLAPNHRQAKIQKVIKGNRLLGTSNTSNIIINLSPKRIINKGVISLFVIVVVFVGEG